MLHASIFVFFPLFVSLHIVPKHRNTKKGGQQEMVIDIRYISVIIFSVATLVELQIYSQVFVLFSFFSFFSISKSNLNSKVILN